MKNLESSSSMLFLRLLENRQVGAGVDERSWNLCSSGDLSQMTQIFGFLA